MKAIKGDQLVKLNYPDKYYPRKFHEYERDLLAILNVHQ